MYFAKLVTGLSLLAGVQAHPRNHDVRGEHHGHRPSFTSSASSSASPSPSGVLNQLTNALNVNADASSFWLEDIKHQGIAAFNSDPSGYTVFRNVKDYGAAGISS